MQCVHTSHSGYLPYVLKILTTLCHASAHMFFEYGHKNANGAKLSS